MNPAANSNAPANPRTMTDAVAIVSLSTKCDPLIDRRPFGTPIPKTTVIFVAIGLFCFGFVCTGVAIGLYRHFFFIGSPSHRRLSRYCKPVLRTAKAREQADLEKTNTSSLHSPIFPRNSAPVGHLPLFFGIVSD